MKASLRLLVSLVCFVSAANTLYASSGTWAAVTDGNWSDSSKWAAGIIADGADFFADTPALSSGTWNITLDSSRTIGFMVFRPNDPNWPTAPARIWVLNGGANTLTLSSSSPLGTGSGPRIRSLGGLTRVNCIIGGSAGLGAPDQRGIVALNAANTYTGDTHIYRGRLQIGNVDALPHGIRTGNVILERGGNPAPNNDFAMLDLRDFSITINGLSSINTNLSGSLLPVQVTSLSSNAGTSTLTLGDNDANGTFDGDIVAGPNGRNLALTKIGAGTQVLNGSNTYTGATAVNAGVLAVNGSSASPVTVNGGLFCGNGTNNTDVVVAAGGNVSGGSGVGTLTVHGLDLSAGGTNIWELAANSDSGPGTNFDQIIVAGGNLDLTDATLIVKLTGSANVTNSFWNTIHFWTIISLAGGSNPSQSNFKKVVNAGPIGLTLITSINTNGNILLCYVPCCFPPPPKITSITGAGTTNVTVNYINTRSGETYTLQYKTNLATTNWFNVGSVVAGGTTGSQVDYSATGGSRYYRVYFVP